MRNSLETVGLHVSRLALAAGLLWVGALKFTAYEASAIRPMVENSPMMSWGPPALGGLENFSKLVGVTELLIALLILSRPFFPRASAFGSLWAAGMFLVTMSFLFTTPGVWAPDGPPVLSADVGQFMLKDAILFGVALLTAGEAWGARKRQKN